jgi:D-alanyl-D-alanine carboxypeptidase/D-alanyl-D-alanine-endopeptidase (penicillin-binding protein 4)
LRPAAALLSAALLLLPAAIPAADKIDAILRRAEAAGGRVGLSVLPPGKRPLLSWRADEPFMTASVAKIVTAVALLAELHPEGTLRTDVAVTGEITAGTLAGDLVIVGGGDPFLVTERLFLLAREIRARGIARVAGRVLLVEGRFDDGPFPASWPQERAGEPYQPSISALGVNFNLAGAQVTPGSKEGTAALISPEPGVAVRGEVTTGKGGSAPALLVGQAPEGLQLGGSLPLGGLPAVVRRRPGDYHPVTARAVRELLAAAGVTTESVVWGALPPDARPLISFPSLPAKALTPLFLGYSNNFMAEVLLRELGARRIGVPGTTEKGVKAAMQILAERKLPTAGLDLADGSGLSRRSKATPAAIAALLLAAAADWEIGEAFAASLPLSGVEGTMEGRFPEERYARRIRAKTGSINGVQTLAGFFEDAAGRRLAFCLMMEGVKEGFPFRDTERAVMDALLAGNF